MIRDNLDMKTAKVTINYPTDMTIDYEVPEYG